MKKLFGLGLVVAVLFLLSACNSRTIVLKYNELDTKVGTYTVYEISVEESSAGYCKAFSVVTIEVDEDTNVLLTYGCMGEGLFIRDDDHYLRFDEAINLGLVTPEEILQSGYGYVENLESVMNLIEFEWTDYSIEEIIVHELNSELATDGSGQWDEEFIVEMTMDQIEEYLMPLLVSVVDENLSCTTNMCVQMKGQAPIKIHLISAEYKLEIEVYDDYIDITRLGDDSIAHIYNIKDDKDSAALLFSLIAEEHSKQND